MYSIYIYINRSNSQILSSSTVTFDIHLRERSSVGTSGAL